MEIRVGWSKGNKITEIGVYDTNGNTNIGYAIGKRNPKVQYVRLNEGVSLLPIKNGQRAKKYFGEMRARAREKGFLYPNEDRLCKPIWAVGLSEAGRFYNGGETSGSTSGEFRFWSTRQNDWVEIEEAEKEYGVNLRDKKATNNKMQAEESTAQLQPAGQPESEKVCTKPRNRIIFGAPGTGKSHKLKEECEADFGENFERVTFHPDYYYSNFVGAYKPVMRSDGTTNKKVIQYEFVPGPFLRVYAKAKNKPTERFLLIVEEINRANVAAVFGDVFQLLDRGENGESEYKIAASEDVKDWLEKQGVEETTELSIPSNMYIWATMNSADQGVFPIDTAFKRRWCFEYLDLNAGAEKNEWNDFRVAINKVLTEKLNVNEDKCMGAFFLKQEDQGKWGAVDFKPIFASKVLMYLFEDAAKHKRNELFKEKTFSAIYNCYAKGEKIFGDGYGELNNLLGLTEKNAKQDDGESNESES